MARSKGKPSKNKRPKASREPSNSVEVRQSVDLESDNARQISWQVGSFDWEGPWGCGNFKGVDIISLVLDKVKNFEGCSWNELPKKQHHSIDVSKLNTAAQVRLSELQQDDTDQVFSLRLQGKHRIYGIKDGSIMRVLWYDVGHGDNTSCVCRSKKKHT